MHASFDCFFSPNHFFLFGLGFALININQQSENQDSAHTSDLRLGVWLRCTPQGQQGARIKPVLFKELSMVVELPKALATLSSGGHFTTIAFRVLHTYAMRFILYCILTV